MMKKVRKTNEQKNLKKKKEFQKATEDTHVKAVAKEQTSAVPRETLLVLILQR